MHGGEDRCSLSLYCSQNYFEIVCYLASGDEIVTLIKIRMKIYTWTAVSSEKRILSYSSQHSDEDGYTLSLCCKFEIKLRLFAIWLVVIKLPHQSKYKILRLGCRAT